MKGQINELVNKRIEKLKLELASEIKLYEEDMKRIENIKIKIGIYDSLNDLMGLYPEIIEQKNIYMMGIQLEYIYPKNISDTTYSSISFLLYQRKKLSTHRKRDLLEDEIKAIDEKIEKYIKRFKREQEELEISYNNLKRKAEEKSSKIANYKSALLCLNHDAAIPKVVEDEIIDYLVASKAEEKNIIIMREIINNHNKKANKQDDDIDSTIFEMVQYQKEKYEVSYKVEITERLSGTVEMIHQRIDVGDYDLIDINESSGYKEEDIEYIYKSLLNIYIKEEQEAISSLNSKTYADEELRELAVLYYKEARDKYDLILEKYNKYKAMKQEKLEARQEVVNEILFLDKQGSGKIYLFDDIKFITKENYDRVITLMKDFRVGIIKPDKIKPLQDFEKTSKLYELKDDQVRIIYRNVKEKVYLFIGVVVKKDTKDRPMIATISSRDRDLGYDEYEYLYQKKEQDFDDFIDCLETNKRKGSR